MKRLLNQQFFEFFSVLCWIIQSLSLSLNLNFERRIMERLFNQQKLRIVLDNLDNKLISSFLLC